MRWWFAFAFLLGSAAVLVGTVSAGARLGPLWAPAALVLAAAVLTAEGLRRARHGR